MEKCSRLSVIRLAIVTPEAGGIGVQKALTAEVYIREARKRVMVDNAFTRLDEHRKQKSVSLTGQGREGETNRGINYRKSKQN